jgi:REP element-mobilizing transposase RayT
MSQSLVQIYLHIVFSTKNRQPFLRNKPLRERTYGYMAGICENLDCPALIIGGVENHVHILCRFGKTIELAALLRELKRDSSKWIKDNDSRLTDFPWQAGYGAFSVSPSNIDALKEYIRNQEEHDRQESFQDEFRRLCQKYGIEIDERYVWD